MSYYKGMAKTRTQEALLEKAYALPIVDISDILPGKLPTQYEPVNLRHSNDTQIRSRLIIAGLAEGIQSPKGPQKNSVKSVILLYPNGDAPRREVHPRGPNKSKHPGAIQIKHGILPQSRDDLPTIGDMEILVKRIREIEEIERNELHQSIHDEIKHGQHAVATAHADKLHEAHRKLGESLAKLTQTDSYIRRKALQTVGNDPLFPQRVYLKLISTEVASA